jgi:hypothetical protein
MPNYGCFVRYFCCYIRFFFSIWWLLNIRKRKMDHGRKERKYVKIYFSLVWFYQTRRICSRKILILSKDGHWHVVIYNYLDFVEYFCIILDFYVINCHSKERLMSMRIVCLVTLLNYLSLCFFLFVCVQYLKGKENKIGIN